MSSHTHTALIIVANDDKALDFELHHTRLHMKKELQQYFVGPIKAHNGFTIWAMLPGGSKNGWGDDMEMKDFRSRMRGSAAHRRADVVEVSFGGDHLPFTELLFTSDSSVRNSTGKPDPKEE